jgi:DNA invertase Pin-like site-specific DNA recombinase
VRTPPSFSLDGPAAEIILAVMTWAAKMERLTINERIAAARERLEAKGKQWGWPSRLSEATRTRIAELRAQGQSLRDNRSRVEGATRHRCPCCSGVSKR